MRKPSAYLARRATDVTAFIQANPFCTVARVMGEFGWKERTAQDAIAYARRVLGVPIASTRFGSQGFETYLQVFDAWPAGEEPA